uniref:Uncharacterized protein n=1 Tax=Triticum urartu TaxID=4572 RepID=A0A8R7QGQ1_TRIUA
MVEAALVDQKIEGDIIDQKIEGDTRGINLAVTGMSRWSPYVLTA